MQINQLPKLSNPMLDEIALRDSVENLRTKINEMRREIKVCFPFFSQILFRNQGRIDFFVSGRNNENEQHDWRRH